MQRFLDEQERNRGSSYSSHSSYTVSKAVLKTTTLALAKINSGMIGRSLAFSFFFITIFLEGDLNPKDDPSTGLSIEGEVRSVATGASDCSMVLLLHPYHPLVHCHH